MPWWLAGGWALDCIVRRQTRDHADLDIEVLRRDQFAVPRLLVAWDLHRAGAILLPWLPGHELDLRVNSIWCRPTPTITWAAQSMFTPADGDQWRYLTITRPIATLGLQPGTGVLFLAPEVQLRYKSRSPRPVDEVDFSLVRPLLDHARSTPGMQRIRGITG